jgi:hypothetical protein
MRCQPKPRRRPNGLAHDVRVLLPNKAKQTPWLLRWFPLQQCLVRQQQQQHLHQQTRSWQWTVLQALNTKRPPDFTLAATRAKRLCRARLPLLRLGALALLLLLLVRALVRALWRRDAHASRAECPLVRPSR